MRLRERSPWWPSVPLYQTWNVIPEDGAWMVRRDDPPEIVDRYEDKQTAIRVATSMALQRLPSQVVVHAPGKTITQCVIYEEMEPPSPAHAGVSEDTGRGVEELRKQGPLRGSRA